MTKQQRETETELMRDPYVEGRIRALVLDLVHDDWPMALHDLERLYRALKTGVPTQILDPVHQVPGICGASIYYEDDGTMVEEFCQGPDEFGECPRAEEGRPIACAGRRLVTQGWDVDVAGNVDICPLLTLGLIKRYLDGFAQGANTRQTSRVNGG